MATQIWVVHLRMTEEKCERELTFDELTEWNFVRHKGVETRHFTRLVMTSSHQWSPGRSLTPLMCITNYGFHCVYSLTQLSQWHDFIPMITNIVIITHDHNFKISLSQDKYFYSPLAQWRLERFLMMNMSACTWTWLKFITDCDLLPSLSEDFYYHGKQCSQDNSE